MTKTESSTSKVGVLLMDVGGPASLDDVEGFVARLMSQRGILPLPATARRLAGRLIARGRRAKATHKYEVIGGKSPIGEEVAAQARALGAALGAGACVDRGFTCATPDIESGVRALLAEGATRLVGVPLFPQASETTSGACAEAFLAAARQLGLAACVAPSFPEGEGYLRCIEEQARDAVTGVDHVLLVAHGLPESHERRGDPYVPEVRRTAASLGPRLHPRRSGWSLAFQSRLGPVRWTGPDISEEIRRLAATGVRSLAIVPLSFACENLETLWDLDREATELARQVGIPDVRRVPAPGSHPAFIDQLAALVRSTAGDQGWPVGASQGREEGAS